MAVYKKVLISLDERVLEEMDKYAEQHALTRSSFISLSCRDAMKRGSIMPIKDDAGQIILKDTRTQEEVEYWAYELNMSPNAFVKYACQYCMKHINEFRNSLV